MLALYHHVLLRLLIMHLPKDFGVFLNRGFGTLQCSLLPQRFCAFACHACPIGPNQHVVFGAPRDHETSNILPSRTKQIRVSWGVHEVYPIHQCVCVCVCVLAAGGLVVEIRKQCFWQRSYHFYGDSDVPCLLMITWMNERWRNASYDSRVFACAPRGESISLWVRAGLCKIR